MQKGVTSGRGPSERRVGGTRSGHSSVPPGKKSLAFQGVTEWEFPTDEMVEDLHRQCKGADDSRSRQREDDTGAGETVPLRQELVEHHLRGYLPAADGEAVPDARASNKGVGVA